MVPLGLHCVSCYRDLGLGSLAEDGTMKFPSSTAIVLIDRLRQHQEEFQARAIVSQCDDTIIDGQRRRVVPIRQLENGTIVCCLFQPVQTMWMRWVHSLLGLKDVGHFGLLYEPVHGQRLIINQGVTQ